jgi:rubrerythrin
MSAMTVAQAIAAAVAMENSVRDIFRTFARWFAGAPAAAQFFESLARDEDEHARLWVEIEQSLPASRLAESASALLVASIASARNLLARNPVSKVETLADACDLARMMENAELLAVFRALASETVSDAKRREFLELQIQGHLNRLEQFASELGRCGRMGSFPAAPAG